MESQEHTPATTATNQRNKPGRRARIPLSCDNCRSRKLKCNREKPCQNCVARNERTSCNYKGSRNGTITHEDEYGDPMQKRIEHLEDLVKKFIAQHQEVPPNNLGSQGIPEPEAKSVTSTSDTSNLVTGCVGATVIDGSKSVYKGTDDWYDVLKEINDLKKVWNQTQDEDPESSIFPTPSHTVDGSSLLFGQVKQIEILEILGSLPPKPEVDILIEQFFDRKNFPITVAPILHEPTFMREYTNHWKDPSQTNVLWLGLLFSILSITMLSFEHREPLEYEGISESLFQLYRQRTAQCLIIGDIAKCLPYTLETLRFNATAELNRKDDNSRGLWMMTGVIVRAAINQGYHRDPSYSTSPISILQAEYRRRVWLSVIGMDNMSSFLMGFPRMMPGVYSDTMEPHNLYDWELSDDTTILPPSRPLTELTPVTYSIVKGRLFNTLGRITDLNNTLGLVSYDTVLEIDNSLYEAYQNIPLHMKGENGTGEEKSKPVYSSYLRLQTLYHQGVCILHRKFIAKARRDVRYKLSRDRCISSALAILSCQDELDLSWYIFSQTQKALTLGAMILFLELEWRRRDTDLAMSSDSGALLQALEKSCALWADAKSSSDEASRVYRILASMLSNFQSITGAISSEVQPQEPLFEFSEFSPQFLPIEDSILLDNGVSAMPNEMDIDWTTWDTFVEGASFESGNLYGS